MNNFPSQAPGPHTDARQRSVSEFESYYQDDNEDAETYYADYAQRYIGSPKAVKWNWAAFLFTTLWLLSRKGYRASFAALVGEGVAFLLLALAITASGLSREWAIGLMLGSRFFLQVLWGFFGNNLYFWDMERRMQAGSQARGVNIKIALAIDSLIWLLVEAMRYFFSS